ncbi:MAG: bifunctional nuclease family protein [Nitrososphaerota archaeon]|nr:bifunctional nuclease family protein [Nitrososphaerota archaeon]MDG7023464.1 bifunctional nuclease family protein [Nitrososphaerota archaeon]
MPPTSAHDDLVPVRLVKVGFADAQGVEGVAVLAAISDPARRLFMRAFSGEVATHLDRFLRGDRSSIPSVYNIVEDLAEREGLHLAKVEIYSSDTVLRGDMSFDGREKRVVLRGYRASDCLTLAILYDAPVLVQSSLLTVEGATGEATS